MSDYITAASSDQVKEGEILAVIIDETPIGLTRLNGRVCAFHDVCTHDDGPLAEGALDGQAVVCPRHGARFNLLTGASTFPAPTGIAIYETIEEDGEIRVRL